MTRVPEVSLFVDETDKQRIDREQAELEALCLPSDELEEMAIRFKPPQEWYDE